MGLRKPLFWLKHFWQSICICLLLLSGTYILWDSENQSLHDTTEQNLKLKTDYILEAAKSEVAISIQELHGLKERIEQSGGVYFDFWEDDANGIIEKFTSYQYVELLDSNLHVTRVSPNKRRSDVYYANYSHVNFSWEAWSRHRHENATISKYIENPNGAGYVYLASIPIYISGRYCGGLIAGLNFTKAINKALEYSGNYIVEFTDHRGNQVYSNWKGVRPSEVEHLKSRGFSVSLGGTDLWNLSIAERPTVGMSRREMLIHGGGLVSALLSFTLAVLYFYWVQLRIDRMQLVRVNRKLKRLNGELRKSWKVAEVASEAKSSFMSRMSHEMRTPLNGILGAFDLMSSDQWPSKEKDHVEVAIKSAQQLAHQVERLLSLNRLESGDQETHKEAIIPMRFIEQILHSQKSHANANAVNVEFEHTNESFRVMADIEKFREVVNTLVSNAIKFTPTGGQVKVCLQETLVGESVYLSLSVKDTGIGIRPEDKERIFNKFEQVEEGATRMFEGAGIGLYLCKKIVTILGGEIYVESPEEGGAEFYVKLVFKQADFVQKEDVAITLEQKKNPLKHILIVEDNEVNILVLRKMLEQLGVKAAVARNGQIAVEMVEKESFELVFMDLHMPVMDGYEATATIRKTHPNLPILALSADVTPAAMNRAMAAGVNEYYSKPIQKSKLVNILEHYADFSAAKAL